MTDPRAIASSDRQKEGKNTKKGALPGSLLLYQVRQSKGAKPGR